VSRNGGENDFLSHDMVVDVIRGRGISSGCFVKVNKWIGLLLLLRLLLVVVVSVFSFPGAAGNMGKRRRLTTRRMSHGK
jgi:hypothetical protein